jgi:site-specific DNA-methyltransferase (adenine-specific)
LSPRHGLNELDAGHAESEHPYEKPTWVMDDRASRLGQTILDPFAGSGTTLMAARRAGLRAIGVEIDEQSFRRAAERLRQATLL